jgi:hypothetical protein
MATGWHGESKRHSIAKKYGEAGSKKTSISPMSSSSKRVKEVSISQRIDNMSDVIGFGDAGHKYTPSPYNVDEGVHYTCLAYTDWADTFVATVVKWKNGKVDSFDNLEESIKNAQESIAIVEKEKADVAAACSTRLSPKGQQVMSILEGLESALKAKGITDPKIDELKAKAKEVFKEG